MLFKQLDLMADRCLRQAQLLPSLRETSEPRDGLKNPQGIQGVLPGARHA